METAEERKEFRKSVKDFWASMSKDERNEFVKRRALKIIEGHQRGGDLTFGLGIKKQEAEAKRVAGPKPRTEECRANISKAKKNKPWSEAQRAAHARNKVMSI